MTENSWIPEFGRKPPAGVKLAWAARAIYHPSKESPYRNEDSPVRIELLHDRQDWTGDKEELKSLIKWVNREGIDGIKKECEEYFIDAGSSEVITFSDDKWIIEASPQASYGYLYIVAYPKTVDAVL